MSQSRPSSRSAVARTARSPFRSANTRARASGRTTARSQPGLVGRGIERRRPGIEPGQERGIALARRAVDRRVVARRSVTLIEAPGGDPTAADDFFHHVAERGPVRGIEGEAPRLGQGADRDAHPRRVAAALCRPGHRQTGLDGIPQSAVELGQHGLGRRLTGWSGACSNAHHPAVRDMQGEEATVGRKHHVPREHDRVEPPKHRAKQRLGRGRPQFAPLGAGDTGLGEPRQPAFQIARAAHLNGARARWRSRPVTVGRREARRGHRR